jgi:hypothetical protein
VTAVVYFQETIDHYIYVGWSSQPLKRNRTHGRDGKTFLAALPATGGGAGTAEQNICDHFTALGFLVPRRGKSTFSGEPIREYVEWLVARRYACATSMEDAERFPKVDFETWHPENAGDPYVDENGQGWLLEGLPTTRQRLVRASDYAHLQSKSDQWLTPPSVIALAKKALGGHIDTDPASCAEANEWIDATHWYSIDNNGLSQALRWKGTVWLNPPYGTGDHSAKTFAERLTKEYRLHNVTAAITCLNLNSASAKWFDQVWQVSSKHLIWRGRIDFIPPGGKQDSSPSKGTILSYFGHDPDLFAEVFNDHGTLLDVVSLSS